MVFILIYFHFPKYDLRGLKSTEILNLLRYVLCVVTYSYAVKPQQCYNGVDYFRIWREMRALTEEYGEKMTPEERNMTVVYPKDPREGIAHCTSPSIYS